MGAETILMETWRATNLSLPSQIGFNYPKSTKETHSVSLKFLQIPLQVRGPKEWFYKQASKLWNAAPEALRFEKDITKAKIIIKEYSESLAFV